MAQGGRSSWRPGDSDGKAKGPKKDPAARPSTQMMRSSDVKRKPSTKPPPRRPDPSEPAPDAHGGRGLSNIPGPPADAPAAPPPSGAPTDGSSPFANYAPGSVDLARDAAVGTESSNQILAIVGGLGFMLVMGIVTIIAILMIGLFTWSQQDDGLASTDPDDPGHIRDTDDIPDIIDIQPKPRSGPRAGPDGGDPDAPAEPVPITTGPISIEIPKSVFFHSLEINCPDAGISRRATFRNRKASTSGVPIGEECMVTFQGSEPAKTTIHGGQNKICVSFNPTECREL